MLDLTCPFVYYQIEFWSCFLVMGGEFFFIVGVIPSNPGDFPSIMRTRKSTPLIPLWIYFWHKYLGVNGVLTTKIHLLECFEFFYDMCLINSFHQLSTSSRFCITRISITCSIGIPGFVPFMQDQKKLSVWILPPASLSQLEYPVCFFICSMSSFLMWRLPFSRSS